MLEYVWGGRYCLVRDEAPGSRQSTKTRRDHTKSINLETPTLSLQGLTECGTGSGRAAIFLFISRGVREVVLFHIIVHDMLSTEESTMSGAEPP